jgi:hypothetical protein
VPRHVTRLITRLVAPLVVDYFTSTARPGASARRAARHAACRAARRQLLRLAQACRRLLHLHRASGCLGTSCGSSRGLSPPLVVDYSASRRLIVDCFASAARPGASTRRAARHAARRAARRRLLRLAQARHRQLRLAQARRRLLHLAQARRRLLRLRCASGCLGTSRGSSHRSPSTTSPTQHVLVPQHVARLVTRLFGDYSVRLDFVLRPRWLYFSHAVRRDYLSRGNTSSTSSTPRAATTSSSGRIASTIHLDWFSKLVENDSHAPNN